MSEKKGLNGYKRTIKRMERLNKKRNNEKEDIVVNKKEKSIEKVTIEDIMDLHYKFECIYPFVNKTF